ncbi:MAG: hypothetical protein VKN15_04705, partial [Cyanobacteriota bacterium]|nr:hypothetical protein [Cyanobacteriota bacterium]
MARQAVLLHTASPALHGKNHGLQPAQTLKLRGFRAPPSQREPAGRRACDAGDLQEVFRLP